MKILDETLKKITGLNESEMKKRRKHLDSLLKTPKGLGKLEDLSLKLSGINSDYVVDKKAVVVMAADNGVEEEGVSASKRVITQHVVEAMLKKEASISSLARTVDSDVFVVDLGIDSDNEFTGIINRKIMRKGTKNIRKGEAMSREEAIKAMEAGIEVLDDLVLSGYNLLALGEMGIGNTTTSSAILSVLTGLPLNKIVGRGSGICSDQLELKKQVIADAIKVNSPDEKDALEVLHKLGGLDIAAMTGAYLSAAKNRVPIVIDGLISGIAALLASLISPECRDYMVPSHLSDEPGARWIMEYLELEPMLHMNMKLGEGSGAVLMFPLVEAASNISRDIKLYPEIE